MNVQGIKVDESKVEAIQSWPIPKSIHDVLLHGFTSFYRPLIRNFSTIITPAIKVIKGSSFK